MFRWTYNWQSLAAVVLVGLNDRLFKDVYGNWLTGKISDVFGAFLVPLLCMTFLELVRRKGLGIQSLRAVCLVSAGALAVVKTTTLGANCYGYVIGMVRTPFRMLANFGALPQPLVHPIDVVVDPTDVSAVFGIAAAYVIGLRYVRDESSGGGLRTRSPVEAT